jgi:hypothetical protein
VRDGEGAITIEVLEEDPLQHERLTRSLHLSLAGHEGVELRTAPTPDAPAVGGPARKGDAAGDLSLVVGLAALAAPTGRVLVAAIQGWCAERRSRHVRVVVGDRSLEITGARRNVDDDLLRALLDDAAERGRS